MNCIGPMLSPDDVTLGTHIELAHIAATPVGMIIRTEVEVVALDGRRVTFAVSAFDEREKIAEGMHERYISERSKFMERLEEKQN